MDDIFTSQDWLKRAKSNLLIGKTYDKNIEEIFFEDLCFELQQCAEKSLKALLIYHGFEFPKTHDISFLVTLIKNKTTIPVTEDIIEAKKLTAYSTKNRYPNWNKVGLAEYNESVILAERVYNWALDIISAKK
jgi:HEPN domain-containing protein